MTLTDLRNRLEILERNVERCEPQTCPLYQEGECPLDEVLSEVVRLRRQIYYEHDGQLTRITT